MIVVDIDLRSAVTGARTNLGTMVIDNVGGTRTRGNYRCRMYRKGERDRHESDWRMAANAKPIREGRVLNHARLAEPVQNLVTKALKEMGYG